MGRAFAKIAFSPSVQKIQEQQGSREAYDRFLAPGIDSRDRLTDSEAQFILQRDSFYQASASKDGWPYVQYKGGPKGFLNVLDAQTLAYADFRGNRQYISAGNVAENNRISLILVDYPNQRRLKIWGHARLVDIADDPDLVNSLDDPAYRSRPERAVIISVAAFDWNCPQHIHPRYTQAELDLQLDELMAEIERLKEENHRLELECDLLGRPAP